MGQVKLEVIADSTSARQNLTSLRSCVESLTQQVSIAAKAFIVWRGALSGAGELKALAGDVLFAGLTMDKLSQNLATVGDSTKIAVGEIGYVRAEAKRMGLDFVTALQQYGNFINTIRGTSLEGSPGRSMFSGMAEGLSAMKMTGEEQGRVFAQITQMMAKQKVELEDVKVIAETGIPIFNMLSEAIGKSTPEMMKMMGNGQLLSLEVFPKLAESMHRNFGQAAEANATSAQGSINRFRNTVFEMKEDFAREWLPTFTSGLQMVNSNMGTLATTAKGLAATIAVIAASRIAANTIAPAVAGAMPYVRNAMNESSGAVALGGATATRMMAAESLQLAKVREVETAHTLALAMAQEKNLMALRSSGAMVQRLAEDEAGRTAGLAMQTRAHAGLAVAAKTTALAEAEHTAAVNLVATATTRYAVAQEAATLTTRALTVASSALKGVLSFFGGWIGLIVTGLTLAGSAWSIYSGKQKEAEKSGMALLENMREQVRTLEERNRVAAYRGPAGQNYTDADQKQIEYLKARAREYDAKADSAIWSFTEDKNRAVADKARTDLQEFYGLKKRLGEEQEKEASRNALQRAKEKADQERMQAEKLADDLRKLEQAKAKAGLEDLKERSKLKLELLKSEYDQGLVSTEAYYRETLRIAKSTMDAELKILAQRKAYIENDLNKLLKETGGKDNDKTIAMRADLLGIQRESDSLRSGLKSDTLRLTDEEKKKTQELKQAVLEVRAADLERAGEFVKSGEMKRKAYEESAEFLRLEREALSGNAEAMEIYYGKERQWTEEKLQNQQKEKDSLTEYQQTMKSLNDELAKLTGTYREETAAEKLLREEKERLLPLENRLRIAKENGATIAVQRLNEEITAVRKLTAAKQQQLEADQRIAAFKKSLTDASRVLSGEVVGWNGNTPILANGGGSFVNGVAAGAESGIGLYSSYRSAPNTTLPTSDSFGFNSMFSNPFVNPFVGSYAVGTDYVPRTGLALVHQGEKIVPADRNRPGADASVSVSFGDIIVNLPPGTPQQNARETAREIYSELQKLSGRRLAVNG